MNPSTPAQALEEAVRKAGSQTALAALLPGSICHAHIYNWLRSPRGAPAHVCPDIEQATGVPCEELRPSTNWAVLRNDPKGKKAKAKRERAVA